MVAPVADFYGCASGGVITAGRHRLPAWLRSAPVGQWSEIAGTVLSSSPAMYQWTPPPPWNVSLTDGWSGWAIDPVTLDIYLQGGGHSDYGGNEICRLRITDDAPDWYRMVDPTPQAQMTAWIDGGAHTSRWNSDGTPVAGHVYWSAHVIGNYLFRGPFYQSFGQTIAGRHAFAPNNESTLCAFNLTTRQWDTVSQRALLPNYTPSNVESGGISYAPCVSDGTYYYAVIPSPAESDTVKIRRYNPVTNVWDAVSGGLSSNTGHFPNNSFPASIFDSSRREIVMIGETGDAFARRISLDAGTVQDTSLTGIAYATTWNSSYTGADYDSKRDRYYLYSGKASTDKNLYICDPNSGYAMSVMSGTGTPTATTPVSGLNSRFKYIPRYDCILMQPTDTSPVYCLRLS